MRVGSLEAPITATERGSINGVRLAETGGVDELLRVVR